MNYYNLFILGILSLGIAHPAMASESLEVMSKTCGLTPLIDEEIFPSTDQIVKSNNLWRMSGSATPAAGKPIAVYGTIQDSNCLPLNGAIIQLWQADAKGKLKMAWDKDSLADAYFAGSGTAASNSSGEFTFLTVYPGAVDGDVPKLFLRIHYKNMEPLMTKLYFPGANNMTNADYKGLPISARALVTLTKDPVTKAGSESYHIDLTLKVQDMFTQY